MSPFDQTTPTIDIDAFIASRRQRETGETVVALDQNVVWPQNGGYPRDHGRLIIRSRLYEVLDVHYVEGTSWLELDIPAAALPVGVAVGVQIDRNRRERMLRLYTLSQIASAAANTVLHGYKFRSSIVCENAWAVRLKFQAYVPVDQRSLREIDILARRYVCAGKVVSTSTLPLEQNAGHQAKQWETGPGWNWIEPAKVAAIPVSGSLPCLIGRIDSTLQVRAFSLVGGRSDENGNCEIELRIQDSWSYWY